MPYFNLDENWNIIAQFGCEQYEGQLYLDCPPPSAIHKPKKTYQKYSGEKQWEIDKAKKALQDSKQALQVKLESLEQLYATFPKAMQYQFKPLKDAVINEINIGTEISGISEMIKGFILPEQVEEARQLFIAKVEE